VSAGLLGAEDIKNLLITEEINRAKELYRQRNWNVISGKILIYPFNNDKLGPFSYDLSVGEQAFSLRERKIIDIPENGVVEIRPGETVLILTEEYIALPPDIGGIVLMRARLVFEGIVASVAKVDPTWYGKLVIAVSNCSTRHIIKLRRGEAFCTLVLLKLPEPVQEALTHARTPFLGQEKIEEAIRDGHRELWEPIPIEDVCPEHIKKLKEWGPPFDFVTGIYGILEKEIGSIRDKVLSDLKNYIDENWGPRVYKDVMTSAREITEKYFKWFIAAIVSLVALVISILIPILLKLIH